MSSVLPKKPFKFMMLPDLVKVKVLDNMPANDLMVYHDSSCTARKYIPEYLLQEVFVDIEFHTAATFNVTTTRNVSSNVFDSFSIYMLSNVFRKVSMRQLSLSEEAAISGAGTEMIPIMINAINGRNCPVLRVTSCGSNNDFPLHLLQKYFYKMTIKSLVVDVKITTNDEKYLDMYGIRHVVANKGVAHPLSQFKSLKTECCFLTINNFNFDDATFSNFVKLWNSDDSPYWIMKGFESGKYRPFIYNFNGNPCLCDGTVVAPTNLKFLVFEDRKVPVVNGYEIKGKVNGRFAVFMSTETNFFLIFLHDPLAFGASEFFLSPSPSFSFIR